MIDPISCSEEAAVASSSCPSEPPQDKAEQAAVHDDAVAYEEPLPLRYPRRHLRRRPAPGRRVPRSRLRHRGRRTLRYLQDLLLSAAAAAAAGCAGELSPAAVVLRRRPGAPSDEPCHALHDLFPGFTGLGSVVNWGGGGGGPPIARLIAGACGERSGEGPTCTSTRFPFSHLRASSCFRFPFRASSTRAGCWALQFTFMGLLPFHFRARFPFGTRADGPTSSVGPSSFSPSNYIFFPIIFLGCGK